MAYRLTGDDEDARDVTQDTYLRAYRALDRFRGDARFQTWLYRITANSASTLLGQRARHRHDELTEEAPVADDRIHIDPVARGEGDSLRHHHLTDALRRLPPGLRSVVVLRERLRPAPRRHRRGARHLGHRWPRCASTGPAVACATTSMPTRTRARPVRCEQLADRLPAAAEGLEALDPTARRHVERCLRCQADAVQYRKVLRAMRALRTEVLVPAPGLLPDQQQRMAVEHGTLIDGSHIAGPLLVIAGAGSGKTNTLAHRVAHLIVNGADPRRILLMTFSRRAATEMTVGSSASVPGCLARVRASWAMRSPGPARFMESAHG